jgi:hypothetical protein
MREEKKGMITECINDYFDIIENYGTYELRDMKYELLFECGRSYCYRKTNDFLDSCIACGGNWGAMLTTGLKELYPSVYHMIPQTPVANFTAYFAFIAAVIRLCGVTD